MTENELVTQPQETENTASAPPDGSGAAPGEQPLTVSVKFNKQIKDLTAEQAAVLAQKGMKFEMIENDFSKLKALAGKHKMSVPEYVSDLEKKELDRRREELLDECGGNSSLADRVIELENGIEADDGLNELKEYFPTVKSLDDLPRAVVESARLKGENLLNSYLKYRLVNRRRQSAEDLFERDMSRVSIGSQRSLSAQEDDGFIKALWGR